MSTLTGIDLLKFCDQDEETRWPVRTKPFFRNGHAYATDGVILIEIPCSDPDTPLTGDRRLDPPNVEPIMAYFDEVAYIERPWPKSNPVMGMADCPVCGENFCEECDGEGFRVCDLGHSHNCEECDGVGMRTDPNCKACDGNGEFKQPIRQDVADQEIDIKYDTLIRELPGPIKFAIHGGNKVLFTFHGGRGIVMGMADWKGK